MLVGKTRPIDGCDGFGERLGRFSSSPRQPKKPESGGACRWGLDFRGEEKRRWSLRGERELIGLSVKKA